MAFIEYDFDPRNLPQDLLAAIGLVVQAATQTDQILNMAIGGCLGVDAECTIAVTAHISVPVKIGMLLSAAEIRLDDVDALDELDALSKAVQSALGTRNDVAHDSFCVHPTTHQPHRFKQRARTHVEVELKPVDVQAIIKDANVIHDAGMNLMDFLADNNLIPRDPQVRVRGHKTKAARKARREKMGK